MYLHLHFVPIPVVCVDGHRQRAEVPTINGGFPAKVVKARVEFGGFRAEFGGVPEVCGRFPAERGELPAEFGEGGFGSV